MRRRVVRIALDRFEKRALGVDAAAERLLLEALTLDRLALAIAALGELENEARALERRPAAIRETFSGKVVLIGSNLPGEDRKRTPDRFMRPSFTSSGGGGECSLDQLGASDPRSGTVPGVFVHAAAVRSALTGAQV
jgi:hypothetical protein